jgi:lipopolysaccharide transport system ATP-binding protein
MTDIAIRAENLGKQFHIGALKKNRNLREALVDGFKAPFRRAANLLRGQATGAADFDETIWALKDVSFEIRRGETVGIIGGNGAGKSTLLKIISRITEPTEGFADIHGRMGSLLEVGTGFHPELTGRDNIYLNGAILGMKKADIKRKFDEIVSFSGVKKFIDTPVKHYSSGMYLRLAFAVAAHMDPEILVVDEVLAVGDMAFQKKCLGKMKTVASEGRTILFVSHNMAAMTQLCDRCIWLADGQVEKIGQTTEVVSAYLSAGMHEQAMWVNDKPASSGAEVHLNSVRLVDQEGQSIAITDFDQLFQIEVSYDVLIAERDLSLTCQILDSQGNIVFETIDTDMPEWKGVVREPGRYIGRVTVDAPLLKPGRYYVTVASFIEYIKVIACEEGAITFDVSEVGYRLNPNRYGVIYPVLKWETERIAGSASPGIRGVQPILERVADVP